MDGGGQVGEAEAELHPKPHLEAGTRGGLAGDVGRGLAGANGQQGARPQDAAPAHRTQEAAGGLQLVARVPRNDVVKWMLPVLQAMVPSLEAREMDEAMLAQ